MIVDTSVLCAVLFGEPAREHLLARLDAAPKLWAPATVPELGEVLDARRDQRAAAFASRTTQPRHPAAHHARPRRSGARRASALRTRLRHPAKLNPGDCFSYALAVTEGDVLLFTGQDFTHTDVLC